MLVTCDDFRPSVPKFQGSIPGRGRYLHSVLLQAGSVARRDPYATGAERGLNGRGLKLSPRSVLELIMMDLRLRGGQGEVPVSTNRGSDLASWT
jgi:hypothetical protein